MSDIAEEDWDRIYAPFNEAHPDAYPDRSLIIADMIASYMAELRNARDYNNQ